MLQDHQEEKGSGVGLRKVQNDKMKIQKPTTVTVNTEDKKQS